MNRKTHLALLGLFIVFTSAAQTNLEPYGSFIRNLNPDFRANTYGAGLRFEFVSKKRDNTTYAGLSMTLPMYSVSELTGVAMSSSTRPSTYTIYARYGIPMLRLEYGGKMYLSGNGNNFGGFNWYLMGALEVIMGYNKPEYTSYDKQLYSLGYSEESTSNVDGTSKFILAPAAYAGTGIEYNLGRGNVFLQGYLSFPITKFSESSESDVAVDTPIPVNVNFGYKIPLKRK